MEVRVSGKEARGAASGSRVTLAAAPRPQVPVHPARVALVRPPMVVPKVAITAPTCPPIGLAYLAGALRAAGHEVVAIDAVGEAPERYEEHPGGRALLHGLALDELLARVPADADVVGVSCMFSHEWPENRQVIEALRTRCPDALMVVGGEHPTALADFVLEDCPAADVVVLGEGEATLAAVVDHRDDLAAIGHIAGVRVRDGRAVDHRRNRSVVRIEEVDRIPAPAWDLFPLETYLERGLGFGVHRGRSMPVLATRGCPYRCSFCSSPAMWSTRWSPRTPTDVVDEIERHIAAHHIDNVDLYDLTAIVRKAWIVEFCELIIARGLRFTWQLPSGTRSEAIDAEVVALLGRAGCRNMSYAPESGSPAMLERIHKRVDLARMKRSMRSAVRGGINCKANIMVGLPGETHADVRRTLRFCVEVAILGLHDLTITEFSPYPGTELFDELCSAGRIPALDDAYFASLATYGDLTLSHSWSEHIGDRALQRYRLAGMALFYAVSYACRPWRLVVLVRNVFVSDTQDSRLEMALRQLLRHRRAPRVAAAQPQ